MRAEDPNVPNVPSSPGALQDARPSPSRDLQAAQPSAEERITRETFARLAEPHRREIKVHCYRMLGSLQEADDAVQETFVKAWDSLDAFEGRSSVKNWLYRIATNACLNVLLSRARRRRLMPQQLGAPWNAPPGRQPAAELPWLQPYPDAEMEGIGDTAAGPERRYEQREAVRLAFVAAIQRLPPRQRATLILSDVIGWPTVEIASLLGGSVASVNSVLQRARATLKAHYDDGLPQERAAESAAHVELLAQYVRAWESRNLEGFVSLLKREATYAMPPRREWYQGREAIAKLFGAVWQFYPGFRLRPIGINGQPGYAVYTGPNASRAWSAHSLHVLALHAGQIAALTMFMQPLSVSLFPAFKLPLALAE